MEGLCNTCKWFDKEKNKCFKHYYFIDYSLITFCIKYKNKEEVISINMNV